MEWWWCLNYNKRFFVWHFHNFKQIIVWCRILLFQTLELNSVLLIKHEHDKLFIFGFDFRPICCRLVYNYNEILKSNCLGLMTRIWIQWRRSFDWMERDNLIRKFPLIIRSIELNQKRHPVLICLLIWTPWPYKCNSFHTCVWKHTHLLCRQLSMHSRPNACYKHRTWSMHAFVKQRVNEVFHHERERSSVKNYTETKRHAVQNKIHFLASKIRKFDWVMNKSNDLSRSVLRKI